jgi:hypothetical protein
MTDKAELRPLRTVSEFGRQDEGGREMLRTGRGLEPLESRGY